MIHLSLLLSLLLSSFHSVLTTDSKHHHDHSNTIQILCIGDSITDGSGASNKKTTSYPPLLEKHLSRLNKNKHFVTKNFGIGGTTMQKSCQQSYWDTEFFKEALATTHASIVILAFGTNDAKEFNWNATAFVNDYIAMIQTFQNMNSHPDVYICIPPPLYREVFKMNMHVINYELPQLIPQIAKETSAKLIDVFNSMGGEKLTKKHLFINENIPLKWPNDGCHPNDLGYKIMAKTIAESIIYHNNMTTTEL